MKKTTVLFQNQNNVGSEFISYAGNAYQIRWCDTLTKFPQAIFLHGPTKYINLSFTKKTPCIIIEIPESATYEAGKFKIDAQVGEELINVGSLQLKPGQAQGKITSYLGPKSLSAQNDSKSMLTAFPTDRYQNSTSYLDTLEYTIIQGSKKEKIRKPLTKSYDVMKIGAESGSKIYIGGHTNNGNTIEQSIKGLSGCPAKIKLVLSRIYPVADGRQFFRATTGLLFDNNNNAVEDGTTVEFILSDQRGNTIGKYNALVVNGIASSWIQNPTHEGYYRVVARICNMTSNSSQIYFSNVVKDFNYQWLDNDHTITIGPVLGNLDQYVPNGTPCKVTFHTKEGIQQIKTSIVEGFATIDLTKLWTEENPYDAELDIYGKKYPLLKKKS